MRPVQSRAVILEKSVKIRIEKMCVVVWIATLRLRIIQHGKEKVSREIQLTLETIALE